MGSSHGRHDERCASSWRHLFYPSNPGTAHRDHPKVLKAAGACPGAGANAGESQALKKNPRRKALTSPNIILRADYELVALRTKEP